MIRSDDTKRGLYQKYRVERIEDHAGKHNDCPFFVLDIKHDRFARAALITYACVCRAEYPALADDIEKLIRDTSYDPCVDESMAPELRETIGQLAYEAGEAFYVKATNACYTRVWTDLSGLDQEAYRHIGEAIVWWTLKEIGYAPH